MTKGNYRLQKSVKDKIATRIVVVEKGNRIYKKDQDQNEDGEDGPDYVELQDDKDADKSKPIKQVNR